jgi:hypothetical protein
MPEGSLEVLSRQEVERLRSTGTGGLHQLLRRCALAVLNVGHKTDDTREVMARYRDFDISIIQQDRGVKRRSATSWACASSTSAPVVVAVL